MENRLIRHNTQLDWTMELFNEVLICLTLGPNPRLHPHGYSYFQNWLMSPSPRKPWYTKQEHRRARHARPIWLWSLPAPTTTASLPTSSPWLTRWGTWSSTTTQRSSDSLILGLAVGRSLEVAITLENPTASLLIWDGLLVDFSPSQLSRGTAVLTVPNWHFIWSALTFTKFLIEWISFFEMILPKQFLLIKMFGLFSMKQDFSRVIHI